MADFQYSDDYLAEALKKDARESSRRYSALGVQALLPTRKTGPASKPNTRFLRNILIETDSHNTALLTKEQEDSRLIQESRKRAAPNRYVTHHSKRSPKSHDRSNKRRRVDDSHDRDSSRRDVGSRRRHDVRKHHTKHHSVREHSSRDLSPNDSFARDSSRRRRSPMHHEPVSDEYSERSNAKPRQRSPRIESRTATHSPHHANTRKRKKSDEARGRDWEADAASDTDTLLIEAGSTNQRHRSRHSIPEDSRLSTSSKVHRSTSTRKHSRRTEKTTKPNPEKAVNDQICHMYDSDSPNDMIGPRPPGEASKIQIRGRGALSKENNAIDSHFTSSYDPSADVRPDSETEDDWDQAMEAIRDRQRWKQQGAERLRSAGFSESEIRKWEKGGEKVEGDVRWKTKGEAREWDRGKVVEADGQIELKPSWAKLKHI